MIKVKGPLVKVKKQAWLSAQELRNSTQSGERISPKRLKARELGNLGCSHSISNHKVCRSVLELLSTWKKKSWNQNCRSAELRSRRVYFCRESPETQQDASVFLLAVGTSVDITCLRLVTQRRELLGKLWKGPILILRECVFSELINTDCLKNLVQRLPRY